MAITSPSSPLIAAGLVVVAMAVLGMTDNMVIMVASDAGLWQFHMVRALMGLPIILIAARISKAKLWPLNMTAVIIRSLLVSASMFFYFGALAFIPVAQSAAGLFTAPIFVLLISFAVYGQKVSLFSIFVVIVGFSGVLLVLQPDPTNLSPAIVMPLISGVLYAMSAIATRRYCANEGALTLLVWFFIAMVLWGLSGCIALAVLQPEVPTGPDGFLLRGWSSVTYTWYALIAAQALGAVVGVGLIFRAYLMAEPSFVSVFEYTMLIFGAFWGWVMWEQTMNGLAFAGVALIMIAGSVLARGERAPRGGGGVAP